MARTGKTSIPSTSTRVTRSSARSSAINPTAREDSREGPAVAELPKGKDSQSANQVSGSTTHGGQGEKLDLRKVGKPKPKKTPQALGKVVQPPSELKLISSAGSKTRTVTPDGPGPAARQSASSGLSSPPASLDRTDNLHSSSHSQHVTSGQLMVQQKTIERPAPVDHSENDDDSADDRQPPKTRKKMVAKYDASDDDESESESENEGDRRKKGTGKEKPVKGRASGIEDGNVGRSKKPGRDAQKASELARENAALQKQLERLNGKLRI